MDLMGTLDPGTVSGPGNRGLVGMSEAGSEQGLKSPVLLAGETGG